MRSTCLKNALIGALFCAGAAKAEEVVVRMIDVNSGSGFKNCQVELSVQYPGERPRWLPHPGSPHFRRTGADGRARYAIPDPPPKYVHVEAPESTCALMCDGAAARKFFPLDEVLQTGITYRINSANARDRPYCHPNLEKLEGFRAEPGEILVFVRKLTLGERWFWAQ